VVKKALGRGLESLIPRKVLEERRGTSQQIPLGKLKPNPMNPRRNFRSEELQDLVSSIQERGVLQPVLVRKKGDSWELIAGERRYRACQRLGLLTIPAIEMAVADVESLELALVENLQRSDLDIMEEAEGYRRLKDEFGLTQEQVAQKVGKDRATVANTLRLLNLPPEVRALVSSGRLSAGHARAVAALESPVEQKKMADRIASLDLTVRDAERLVQGSKGPSKKSKGTAKQKDPNVAKLEEDLRHWLKTKVTIQAKGKNKGTICLDYYSLDDLDRILSLFRRAGLR
jgi:ParB family chromosome partitioning protein